MPLKTARVLKVMSDVIKRYENDCKQKPAGIEGETRKLNFEQLLEKHQDSFAECLVVKIYDFYTHDPAFNSRLIRYIEDGLFQLLFIQSNNEFLSYRKCGYLKDLQQLAEKIGELRASLTKPVELRLIC